MEICCCFCILKWVWQDHCLTLITVFFLFIPVQINNLNLKIGLPVAVFLLALIVVLTVLYIKRKRARQEGKYYLCSWNWICLLCKTNLTTMTILMFTMKKSAVFMSFCHFSYIHVTLDITLHHSKRTRFWCERKELDICNKCKIIYINVRVLYEMKVCQSLSGRSHDRSAEFVFYRDWESNCDQSKFPCRSDKEIAVF